MKQTLTNSDKPAPPVEEGQNGPGSWAEALAGALPFLIIGLAVAILESPHGWPLRDALRQIGFLAMLGGYLLILVGLGIGWMKGFPGWVFPYIGYGLIFPLYMMGVATPGLRIFGYTFGSNDLWGWRAWIPFMIMVAVCLLLSRSTRPFKQLVRGVWEDWTRLSFCLYGFLPLVTWISFDEVDNAYQFPFMLLLTFILAGGAVAYVRSATTGQRVLSLVSGLAASGIVVAVGNAVYWHGRQEFWMSRPADGIETLVQGLALWTVLTAFTLSPAVLGLLRRSLHSLRR